VHGLPSLLRDLAREVRGKFQLNSLAQITRLILLTPKRGFSMGRMRQRIWIIYFFAAFLVAKCFGQDNSPLRPTAPVDQLIPWLLDEQAQLRGIPFGEPIGDVTGRKCWRSIQRTKWINAS
jgi:hypothetical protein